jgi:hypothetical protein
MIDKFLWWLDPPNIVADMLLPLEIKSWWKSQEDRQIHFEPVSRVRSHCMYLYLRCSSCVLQLKGSSTKPHRKPLHSFQAAEFY